MKMTLSFIIYFLSVACTFSTEKKQSGEKVNQPQAALFNLPDSTKLIDSLYKNRVILNAIHVDSFICSHRLDTETNKIEITCITQINNHKLGYVLELTDTANKYNKEDFYPSDEFRYDNSYLILEDKKLPITQLNYTNDSGLLIDPVNVWYGNGFGPVAKYYLLPDKNEIFLIRGINYYCNGTNCSNYKVFVLQKSKEGNTKVSCINYPGNYPFGFENTFIFYRLGSSTPNIYSIKKGKTGERTTDFEVIPL